MVYEISKSSIILVIFFIMFVLLVAFCSKNHLKIGIILAIALVGAFYLVADSFVVRKYTMVVEKHPIDFIKEDANSDLVTYGYLGENFSIKRTACEIIVINDDAFSLDSPAESSGIVMPYMEKHRTVTQGCYSILGQQFNDEPIIKNKIYFYISQSYLNNSDWDWTSLFGSKK